MHILPRIMIAGTHSGCGKTTITCALLKAFSDLNLRVSAFKCGPDYIDPMFHEKIIGAPSSNLDIFLTGEKQVKYLLAQNAKSSDISVIEGAMGFYDGLGGNSDYASASHLSSITDTPVVLAVDAKGASLSICAVIKGFYEFKENNIAGIILNRCSSGIFETLKKNIEKHIGIKVFGYLPALPDAEIGSRHLGLVTAAEIQDLKEKVSLLGRTAENSIDLRALLSIANKPYSYEDIPLSPLCNNKVIAVAYDKAFCFYYADNLCLLERLGARLRFFSPLANEPIPADADGLILGGGYPEIYAGPLSKNTITLSSVKKAVINGIPTIAECGGFMYLHEKMCGFKMAGVINGEAYMSKSLVRFGYIKLTANRDNLLCEKDESINAHEFHYSDSENPGTGFTAYKNRRSPYACIHATPKMYAGYPHLNLWGNLKFAENFIKAL